MTELTFFEIHLHDGLDFSATNTAPAIGGFGDEASSDETENSETDTPVGESAPTGDGDTSRLRIGALVALVLLVALAAAAKYLRGGDDLDELVELDEEVEN